MNSEEIEKTDVILQEIGANSDANTVSTDDIDQVNKNLIQMDNDDEQERVINSDADLDEQIRNNMLHNVTLADAEMKMFGDRTILAQIAQLIAYIRHSIKTGQPTEISLSICKSDSTVSNAEFIFDLNGCQVPDLVPQREFFIN